MGSDWGGGSLTGGQCLQWCQKQLRRQAWVGEAWALPVLPGTIPEDHGSWTWGPESRNDSAVGL